ncbi:MAG: SpoIIE family protein phosphatase [Blastocatellia bacterium]
MQHRRRFIFGLVIFALLFFYLGVRVYFVFFHVGSYDGWFGEQKGIDKPVLILRTDPNGPATALQAGDEMLAINGITPRQDPSIMGFAGRVPPGTSYTMTVRRQGQELNFRLTTATNPPKPLNWPERFYLLVNLIFLLTGLFVFLAKPDDEQVWLLALMLGTAIALNTWVMPVMALGRGVEFAVSLAKILGLWSLPLLVHLFLIFPARSPLLQRWPKLTTYLYWPFYVVVLPVFGGSRLPDLLRRWYITQPPIKWLDAYYFFFLPISTVIAYLAFGLICLGINYRVANQDSRRRLRVIMLGSGSGFLMLLLVILTETLRLQKWRFSEWLELGMIGTAPLIPLSFAYAIIRHKVIPISLIIRRGVRYILVTRGTIFVESILAICCAVLYVRTFFPRWDWKMVVFSAAIGIAAWKLIDRLHRRYVAPAIDRRFFRQAYNAQQIMTELADSLRSTTNRDELLKLGATKIQAALQTEHVTILLPDEATKEYTSVYSRSHNGTSALRLAPDADLVRQLRASNQPLELDEKMYPLPASLLVPLKSKEELSGIIALGARRGDLPFSNDDKQLLQSVAAPMSFALENTRLIEQMIEDARRREELEAENEQRAKELEEARQLQLSMLPKQVPQFPNLEIAAYMKTATEVGGDYYDFHVREDGALTIAIGDATGHGLKAGTVVTATKSLFNELAGEEDLPAMLKRFSRALKKMNLRSLFMALTVARVTNNGLTITAAGMPPILIYRAAERHIEEVFLRALPLGSVTNYNYQQQTVPLASGDIVVLMSDGFPERFNPANEMLGYEQASHTLVSTAHLSSQEILTRLVQIGDEWGQNRLADDDVTFVVLKMR